MIVKKCSILACGSTGQYWDGTGDSIGVNDCWKWGHPTDYLLLIDPPNRFESNRKRTIEKSNPHHLITNTKTWLRHFWDADKADKLKPTIDDELFCTNGGQVIRYRFSRWKDELKNDRVQYSRTSPFAAISLAYILGYKHITIWGVDFKDHRVWKDSNPHMMEELDNYKALFEQLDNAGVSVSVGHKESLLSTILPVLV